MKFNKVVYKSDTDSNIGNVIARIDNNTGELQLNKNIFDYLPKGFQEFVLHHENGHLMLKTKDEFQANLFAIRSYVPANTTTDELGRKIVVMTQALTPGADKPFWHNKPKTTGSRYSNFDVVSGIAGALQGLTSNLSVLGIGSKQRINETNAAANAQAQIVLAQAEANKQNAMSTNNMILVGAGSIVVIIIIFFTVKSF